ncbi:MAG: bifunctional 5,10-methylenetetrahydrofolate dehydrogenase/5,10-methenyltetrahydrofolate cyclohydrolase [Syntrophomonadaceae bacterium]|nr:bifunctional 5,10-methylenetetrahydrofolate dehydrogenase/5,10-methenyltetrahydrofolate cyclohydrolase [Syntrophomonadaceae bacterium]
MEIISGKNIADQIKADLKEANTSAGISPCLMVIDVGDNKENSLYIGLKKTAVELIGGRTRIINLAADASREELLSVIKAGNEERDIHGILLQLPLSESLEPYREEFLEAISPQKDVDGFNPYNRGLLMGAKPYFISCAALACMDISRRYQSPLPGKKVLLVGDSFDVIQPLALMYIKEGCRVTISPEYQSAMMNDVDIAVIEKGAPLAVQQEGVKAGALLIDAGFHWHENHVCGNVDKEAVAGIEGYLLPVPGGMGPLLIAALMDNLSQAARKA